MIREGPFRGRELFGVIKDKTTEKENHMPIFNRSHTHWIFFMLVVPLKAFKCLAKPPGLETQHLSSEQKAGFAA